MNISVFLAPGFEEVEALTVVDYLRRAGQNVVSVSLQESGIHAGGAEQTVVTGSHGISVVAHIHHGASAFHANELIYVGVYFNADIPPNGNTHQGQLHISPGPERCAIIPVSVGCVMDIKN